MKNILKILFILILIQTSLICQTDWYKKESDHFQLIYRKSHDHLSEHILVSAELVLEKLSEIFDYTPSEKIIINTYSAFDFGFGSATTVPQNYIRIEIEQFEPGYESTIYNERFSWLLSHELVHIIVNDQAANLEKFFRKLFSKVAPEQTHPQTTIFSLLTNFSRYTPRWHQEGIAVFFETWLSGGFGRVLGSFDEMYFRSFIYEGRETFDIEYLETFESHNSFLLEKLFYFFGARFIAYLAETYSVQQVLDWYIQIDGEEFLNFEDKFEVIFDDDFNKVWFQFLDAEKKFQQSNINKIKSANVTLPRYLSEEYFGWVTNPVYDKSTNKVYFGFHRSHELATAVQLDLNSGNYNEIFSLPSPSFNQVSSFTMDKVRKNIFYTKNNNKLFRDVMLYNMQENKSFEIFSNARAGDLTVSDSTGELWGIRHAFGHDFLIYSKPDYNNIIDLFRFDVGQEIFGLSISPDGKKLAAILHQTSGKQTLIYIDVEKMKITDKLTYEEITDKGSPENPSWNDKNNVIFYNSFTNGISNIYSYNIDNKQFSAHTNAVRGFFKPIQIKEDSLFVFEFTTNGFVPAVVPNEKIERVPAIEYFGNRIIEKNEFLYDWKLDYSKLKNGTKFSEEEEFSPLSNISMLTLTPTVSGFQNEIVIGAYSRFADPMFNHDFYLEAGISPFEKFNESPKFHFKTKYEYKKRLEISYDYNAPDFYDIFNKRKRSLLGQKITLGYKDYWIYDNPETLLQKFQVSYYTDMEFINDNLVRVSEPDFGVAQTQLTYQNLRKSIGSSDFEKGNKFELTLRSYGTGEGAFSLSGQIYGEYSHFTTWFASHNILHLFLSGGYHKDNSRIFQSRFFFGGFGNRIIENEGVKQYRKVFRFPGLPIYSHNSTSYAKIMIENNFPPIRFKGLGISHHLFKYLEFSIYSQHLFTNLEKNDYLFNIGGQINLVFDHWFNLESTLSFGAAEAWKASIPTFEWFISYKLLKN